MLGLGLGLVSVVRVITSVGYTDSKFCYQCGVLIDSTDYCPKY